MPLSGHHSPNPNSNLKPNPNPDTKHNPKLSS